MKLLRILVLFAGVALLMRPAPAFQPGACYANMNSFPDTECGACCMNADQGIMVTSDGYGTGNQDFSSCSVNCGGESSPGSCYPQSGSDACPSAAGYQCSQTNPSCGGMGGDDCASNNDCQPPYVCGSGGVCVICTSSGRACSSNADCCSGTCDAALCSQSAY